MKGLPTLIRVRQWELEEKRRKLADLEGLAVQLEEAIARLDDEVKMEQGVATASTEVSFAYAPYAQAAIERRRTLKASLEDVRLQIEAAAQEVTAAYQELKKYEVANDARRRRARVEASRREQIVLDEIAIEGFRRTTH
ncbi:MAG TPA: flagellar FliJ family protein [Candidatus Sulfotelmatobacter sp.]|nr:flagellar FliJ family protein [Candidatus Sulfotelmatobacter sp.]